MLVFTTPEDLRAEPDAVRFWHLAVLMSLRDKAERLEVRFGEEGTATLYHRISGRDWELSIVDPELFPELKPTLRKVGNLVSPERPEGIITFGVADARLETQQVGWLTYQFPTGFFDMTVRIDPREPFGSITIDLEYPEEMAALAAEALADYFELTEPQLAEPTEE
jgi:hypothetical protein